MPFLLKVLAVYIDDNALDNVIDLINDCLSNALIKVLLVYTK